MVGSQYEYFGLMFGEVCAFERFEYASYEEPEHELPGYYNEADYYGEEEVESGEVAGVGVELVEDDSRGYVQDGGYHCSLCEFAEVVHG